MAAVKRWLRALWERFGPAEVPQGWDVDSLDEIRPHFTDPWQLDDEDTAVVIVVDPHLGPLDVIEPVRPWLFEAVDAEQPVAWDWEPAWLRDLAVAV